MPIREKFVAKKIKDKKHHKHPMTTGTKAELSDVPVNRPARSNAESYCTLYSSASQLVACSILVEGS